MMSPNMSELYGSQTRILEGGTKDTMRIFEALFNGSWPKLKSASFENPHFIVCSSFQNLMATMQCGFSKHFARALALQSVPRTMEKSIERPHFIVCSSFQIAQLEYSHT
jgi:hypothetical protein